MKKLIKLRLPLHTPDGEDILKLGHVPIDGRRVCQKPAGEALHGDKAHVLFQALFCQGSLPLCGQIIEGELKCIVKA